MTEEIRKLLGGYATGTLTEEERQELFAAALEDQALFEALADEQALKELLEDSAARAALLRATETGHFSIGRVLGEWLDRPKAKVLVGVGAVLLVTIAVRETRNRQPIEERQSETVAELRVPPAPEMRRSEPAVERAAPPAAGSPKPQARSAKAARAKAPDVEAPVAAELRSAAPAAAAVSPPPPPAAEASPEGFTRVARAGDLEMKYTVLLRSEAGEYVAVPPEHSFGAGDRARIRIETNRPGMLTVKSSADAQPVTIRNVLAHSPVVLPADVAFEQPGSQSIEVTLLPQARTPHFGFTAVPDESRRAAAPQTRALGRQETADAAVSKTSAAPGVLTVEIKLEQKQP